MSKQFIKARNFRNPSKLKQKARDFSHTSDDFQPQILKKKELKPSRDAETQETDLDHSAQLKLKPLVMKFSENLIHRNHLDTSSLLNYLDQGNSSFYVVGVIGMKNSGKSTILNLIATGQLSRCKHSFSAPLFKDFSSGHGTEAFITENRIFLLDSAPILHNTSCRDVIISEADDIRQIQALFRLCHEILIVFEGPEALSLLMMIVRAKKMMDRYEFNEPVITLVENRVRFGAGRSQIPGIAQEILKQNGFSNFINVVEVLDFNRSVNIDEDQLEVIHQLRDDINTRKELKTYKHPEETEKSWFNKFVKLDMSGNEFVKRFEMLKDKFYQ